MQVGEGARAQVRGYKAKRVQGLEGGRAQGKSVQGQEPRGGTFTT